MSSEGDRIVFEQSISDTRDESSDMIFTDKNWTFITDTTSNSGNFSGQIQFDLSTLSSQSQWVDLSQAVIEFPVKLSCVGSVAPGASAIPGPSLMTLKNGFHQFIAGCSVIVNGQTIQSTQPMENVAATFRILSEWSQDTMTKYGRSCGVILDDCTGDSSKGNGLSNVAYTSTYDDVGSGNSYSGFRAYGTAADAAGIANKALAARASIVSSQTDTTAQRSIMTAAAMKQAGIANYTAANAAACYTANYLATVRLRDIADISNFPVTKNLRGFIYINYNSATVTVPMTTTIGVVQAAMTMNVTNGQTCPFMIDTKPGTSPAVGTYTFTGAVDGTDSNSLSTNARVYVPYYIASPKADLALTQTDHFFATKDKIVNFITASAGNSVNVTLTAGVSNPTGLLLLPLIQNYGVGSPAVLNPEASPLDSAPGTSGPFAQLSQLQVYVSNKPQYQNPINYNVEQWFAENSKTGLGDGLLNDQSSGLLTQQLWEQNHRYYYTDLSRRTPSEDGASRSVQVSFTNATNKNMKVVAIVFYEKKWTINTGTCAIKSAT